MPSQDELVYRSNLAQAIDALRVINLNQQDMFGSHRDMYHHALYARELQTVGINPGRQTGKTTFIAETATPLDFVIVHSTLAAQHLKRTMQCKATVVSINLACQTDFWSKLAQTHQAQRSAPVDVYVDDASYYTRKQIEALYENFSTNLNISQYVLLG